MAHEEWIATLTTEEMEQEADAAERCMIRSGRLSMTDAYNYHRDRASALRAAIQKRAQTNEAKR